MKEYLLIIEPHADDAFLSVGGHIENWTKEGRRVFITTVTPQSEKRLREAEQYAKAVGAGYIRPGEELPRQSDTQCILPVGVQHLEHIAVAEKWNTKYKNIWHYLDMPYALKLKNAEEVIKKIRGAEIVSYLKPPARKWRHVPIFKDQAKFFHFNEETLPKIFELIVRIK